MWKNNNEIENKLPITKAIKNRRVSCNIKACSPFGIHRKLKYCAS